MKSKDLINQMEEKGLKLKNSVQYPSILDIHPVLNSCNLKCSWCIGKRGKELNKQDAIYLNFEDIYLFLNSAFDKSKLEDWPKEVHICGNNSEPLLNEKFVKKLVKYLYGKCKVKIITNGVLLYRYFDVIKYIDKINISLDVLSKDEFYKKKGGAASDYQKIFENINKISKIRELDNLSSPIIYVSFVIDEIYDIQTFYEQFEVLKSYGVNHIHIRQNYFSEDSDRALENKIKILKQKLNKKMNVIVDYNNESINDFDIKYNEKCERRKPNSKCYAKYLWPTISANLRIYPCAHTANQEYDKYAVCIKKEDNYYELFDTIYKKSPVFICSESNLCPSNINYVNSQVDEYYNRVQIKSYSTVFENNWISLKLYNIRLNGYDIVDYNVVDFKNDSVVVLVKNNSKILVTKNFRFVVNKTLIELPAGNVECDESVIEAARREVYEETGINIENESAVLYYYPSNGIVNQKIYVVFADYKNGDLVVQTNEIKEAYWEDLAKLKEQLMNNEISDGPSVIALSRFLIMCK